MSYVILARPKCRKDAQQSVRAGIKLESRYEGSDKNVLHYQICVHIREPVKKSVENSTLGSDPPLA